MRALLPRPHTLRTAQLTSLLRVQSHLSLHKFHTSSRLSEEIMSEDGIPLGSNNDPRPAFTA